MVATKLNTKMHVSSTGIHTQDPIYIAYSSRKANLDNSVRFLCVLGDVSEGGRVGGR